MRLTNKGNMENRKSKNIVVAGQIVAIVTLSQNEQVALSNTVIEALNRNIADLKNCPESVIETLHSCLYGQFLGWSVVRHPQSIESHLFPDAIEFGASLSCDEVSEILAEYKKFRQELKLEKLNKIATEKFIYDFDEVELTYKFCLAIKEFIDKKRGKVRFTVEYSTCDIKDYKTNPPKELNNVPCAEIKELEGKKRQHTFYRLMENGKIKYTVC